MLEFGAAPPPLFLPGLDPVFDVVRQTVETATGWPGLVIIWGYSFLIAFILPLPSEIVLAAPLDLGLSSLATFSLITLVSGIGKAMGSVFAFHIGQEVKEAGPVIRGVERLGIPVRDWSQRGVVRLARRYGYAGLAMALVVPGFPDTLSIYAFAVLERDYVKFAAATFVGSVGRLVFTGVVFTVLDVGGVLPY